MRGHLKRPEVVYEPAPTVQDFLDSDAQVKAIMGPVGSGKSVACCIDILSRIQEQPKSRWVIVRNTYRELTDTTLATWRDWTRGMGQFKQSDMTWTCVNGAEVLFRALDKPQDIGKLLSLEVTGAFLNECRQIPRAVFDMVQTRVGRYPRKSEGGAKWYGVICDTNPCDDFHWFYKVFDEQRPEGWAFFRQPSGLGPDAENVDNLPPDYYENIAKGKDQAWIDVYCKGNYGYVQDGRPVYPQYVDRLHTQECTSNPSLPLFVGIDYGLTPAAVFMQLTPTGQYQAFRELVTEDMAAVQFSELLGKALRHDLRGHKQVSIWGDPAGEQRSQVDARTPQMILKAAGIHARSAPTNDPRLRVEAVVRNLTRLDMAGEPGLIVDPSCRYLRRAMTGGYKYKLMQVVGEELYHEHPVKNQYSHPAEALQYCMLGAGEARIVVGARERRPLDYTDLDRGLV